MTGGVKWHQRLHSDSSSATADDCTWDMAARLIRELNGRDRTDVFLGYLGDEGLDQQLSVAGGSGGRYLVVAQQPGRYFYLARRPAPTERGAVEVVVGGLPAYYPPALVQPLDAALSAAEHYFRTGRRARKLSWIRDDVAELLRRRAEGEWLRQGVSDQTG